MERKLNSSPIILIHPASKGWQVCPLATLGEASRHNTLSEACASLPGNSQVEIALPTGAVVVERMTLPALDRQELRGMVHLQLEKSLPFPVEEVTCDFQVIKQTEAESTLLALAVHDAHFATLCQPLRDRSLLPQRASFYPMHLGQLCPEDAPAVLIYQEEEKRVLAIYEKQRLAFLQILPSVPTSELMAEIPAVLFGAELDGVATDFSCVCLDVTLAELEPGLQSLLSLPVRVVSLTQIEPVAECDLLPESFQLERKQKDQFARIKSNLVTAAIAYLLVLALGFGVLIFLQHRVNQVDGKIAALQPDMEFVKTRVARWNELAPAIDKERFVVELLFQVCSSMPSDEIRITTFEVNKDQFLVEGEAPSAALAIDFTEQLKKNASLQNYEFVTGPPTLLPNEHAQMRIIGKL